MRAQVLGLATALAQVCSLLVLCNAPNCMVSCGPLDSLQPDPHLCRAQLGLIARLILCHHASIHADVVPLQIAALAVAACDTHCQHTCSGGCRSSKSVPCAGSWEGDHQQCTDKTWVLCTGFAITEALVVLAAVLQQVELQPLPWRSFPAAQPRITLRPGHVKLFLKPRP